MVAPNNIINTLTVNNFSISLSMNEIFELYKYYGLLHEKSVIRHFGQQFNLAYDMVS